MNQTTRYHDPTTYRPAAAYENMRESGYEKPRRGERGQPTAQAVGFGHAAIPKPRQGRKNAADLFRPYGAGAADKAASFAGCKSPRRQLPGFGRLVYPMHAKATTRVLLGRKRHHCPMDSEP